MVQLLDLGYIGYGLFCLSRKCTAIYGWNWYTVVARQELFMVLRFASPLDRQCNAYKDPARFVEFLTPCINGAAHGEGT